MVYRFTIDFYLMGSGLFSIRVANAKISSHHAKKFFDVPPKLIIQIEREPVSCYKIAFFNEHLIRVFMHERKDNNIF